MEDDPADRTFYGIEGPRRRPRPGASDQGVPADPPVATHRAVVALPDAEEPGSSSDGDRTSVMDRWLEESRDRMLERTAERPPNSPTPPELVERFEALRVAMETELGRQIDGAVGRMQRTFEQEIEALRTMNREEAKRLRAANGEALVRIRASDTQELERIRRSIEEGIERLCSLLEGQLDRVWSANDVELERIRSAGADRLAEVHDLLMRELERVREQQEPVPARTRFRWWRRVAAD